ncbi:hypothetical protein [Frigoriglobus tundricola]|uniref:Uncharacterized protein n=1 Tax=Frigoriglobus tundricola TaxID=2774151 RepID=A0A6M5YKS4_9BACT|nr:hypothetical protein [Frigoriglobus tundricola]QJW93886.1 hypothetical protein FTUN_1400 [Frigoriglobus tundricola]
MRWLRVAGAVLGLVSIAETSVGADTVSTKVLANNVVLEDVVVVLDVPEGLDGTPFGIFFVDSKGDMVVYPALARIGQHVYDLRHRPDWRGRARIVGTTLVGANGRVRQPTTEDEIDSFLEPEPLIPSTVNVLQGHHLFGMTWEWALLLLFVPAAVFFYSRTHRVEMSLLLGFCLAWAVMDARSIADHASAVRWHEAHRDDLRVTSLGDGLTFADRAAPTIGDGSWTADASLDAQPLARNYLVGYAFADRRYRPNDPGNSGADFLVTCDPTQGEVVVSHGGLYLVRRTVR